MPMAAIAVAATADERCGPAGGRRAVVILDDAAGHDQTFDPSYRALKPGHQRFFRRLGVSPCACLSLPAAAALGGCTLAEAEKAARIVFRQALGIFERLGVPEADSARIRIETMDPAFGLRIS